MNDGHTVVAIDGLKIEPLPPAFRVSMPRGARVPFRPIRDVAELCEPLDDRVMAGFGGVAEYGITVRWDKNFLKIIRLLLERRGEFAMFGGVRFGGTLTIDSAFALGFDHIALCAGAGRPTIVPMKNGLAAGVRQASDFLMALQLTGAAKTDSLANLQVRLPVVVIGGGLTAIDTATEALAYYPLQVEKFLSRYETLVAERGEAAVRAGWTAQEAEIADEFLEHARAIRAERGAGRARGPRAAARGAAAPVGRRHHRLSAAPDRCAELHAQPRGSREGAGGGHRLRRVPDAGGGRCSIVSARARALRLVRARPRPTADPGAPPLEVVLPARTILVAAGTQPNTVLAREEPEHVAHRRQVFPGRRRERAAGQRPSASPSRRPRMC